MTRTGPWTCSHYRCLKHQTPALSDAVGHSCCGRCSEGVDCKQRAWGGAPLFPHPFEEGLVTSGVCTTCKGGPH